MHNIDIKNSFSCHYYHTSPMGSDDPYNSTNTLMEEFRRISLLRGKEYLTHDEAIRLPLDQHIFDNVKNMAEKYYTSQIKYIIVIGIGGSNLGTKAVYDSLRGQFDLLTPEHPKIIFLDTVSERHTRDIEMILSKTIHHKDELLINLISKSGATIESIVNFEHLMSNLTKRLGSIDDRVVCTTDRGTQLWNFALKNNYGLLEIPKIIGGRYSVFTPVALFPLMLCGIDIISLREGARDMLSLCTSKDPGNQHARRFAEILYAETKKGVSMLNIFHFTPELESLGKWERQLIAESLGKKNDLNGKVVRTGITPIVSIGSTDLHSMAQLYFGGPTDKFTMLISTETETKKIDSEHKSFNGAINGIKNMTQSNVMNAIFQGVMEAYRKNKLPFAEVRLAGVTPYNIGAYMQWRMLTTIHLATLMHVNPYDQPSVEDYKEGTRNVLQNLNN